MFRERGLHHARASEVRNARHSFEEDGWKVFVLPDGIKDHESFVSAATALFPLNPEWNGHSWDAFAGSLFEGLLDLPEGRIAFLWPDASTLAISNRKTYRTALECLKDVSDDLADQEATEGNPKDLVVVGGALPSTPSRRGRIKALLGWR